MSEDKTESELSQRIDEDRSRTMDDSPRSELSGLESNRPAPQEQVEKTKVENVRAENEDDDGYDPWSDRKESTPLWEEDPWR